MKPTSMKLASLVLLCAVAASSCGGGNDDESGSPTALSITPSSITLTGGPGVCGSGTVGNVLVTGGVAPYRIFNTVPDYISVDKTEVAHRNESFTVTFLGGCLDPGNVVVIDSLNRQVVLTLTNQKGETTTP